MQSRRRDIWAAALSLIGVSALAAKAAAQPAETPPQTDHMRRLEELEYRLGLQEDIEGVRRLQNTYNYYNTNGLDKEVISLVSEHAVSIEIGGRGVYYGKAGFIRCFDVYGRGMGIQDVGKKFGDALFQLTSMDVITIAPDRQSAKARWQVLTPTLREWPDTRYQLNAGVYEMEYLKENDRWMISKFKYVHVIVAHYNRDGTITPGYSTAPDIKADAPTTWYHPWPEEGCLPFHFPNPITGQFPPDVVTPQHYWIGNWPGEFGKTGHV